jgi:hypothetical protein
MSWFRTMSAAFAVAVGVMGCSTETTGPNIHDPNGPNVHTVMISYCVDIGENATSGTISILCYPSATLAVGNSAQLSARALNDSEDLTSQCNWVWRSNSSSVTIRVNQPSRTAIVTKNPFNISAAQITVTATCNGVSGSYNIM